MNTRSRFTISAALGLALVGGCLGSAKAQTTMPEDDMMAEWTMIDPAPLGYPFAAPGGLHLYHYVDYSKEGIAEGSATMKRMDNRFQREKMLHERVMQREDRMMMSKDEEEESEWNMKEPAPINYPFAAPGGVHLYHWTDYTHEGLAEGTREMKKMENEEKWAKKHHEREKMYGSRMVDENGDTMWQEMKEPAPIGYPFAAPGGVHLYHWTDYTEEGLSEGTREMKKQDNEMKTEKVRHERQKQRNMNR